MIPAFNRLFFSGLLPARHPHLWQELQQALAAHHLAPELLPHTRDVWAVDHMPVQVSDRAFVQFRYEPGYLTAFAKHRLTITDVNATIQPQRAAECIQQLFAAGWWQCGAGQ